MKIEFRRQVRVNKHFWLEIEALNESYPSNEIILIEYERISELTEIDCTIWCLWVSLIPTYLPILSLALLKEPRRGDFTYHWLFNRKPQSHLTK
jgi:hypothetical protein